MQLINEEMTVAGWGLVDSKTNSAIAESVVVGDMCDDGSFCLHDANLLPTCFTNCPVFLNSPDYNGVNTWYLVAFMGECKTIAKCTVVGDYWNWIQNYVTDYWSPSDRPERESFYR
jgi:hypothetical protein